MKPYATRSAHGLGVSTLLSVVLVAVAMAALLGPALLRAAQPPSSRRAPLTPEQRKAVVYAQYAQSQWPRLAEPKPGEWLAIMPEPGQTYEEYVRTARNLKSASRNVIYVLPLGEMDEPTQQTIRRLAAFGAVYFDTRVRLLKPAEIPRAAYTYHRKQYNAAKLLTRMARRVPDDALAVVAVTTADLYSGDLEYIFGLASLRRRVAVISLRRYGEADSPEFLRRTLKNFVHETSHVLGLRHCIFYRCCMNGSNSLEESDSQPMHTCPLCHDKLRHALAFDPEARFERLAAAYDKLGFKQDARLVRERLARLRRVRTAHANREEP